MGSLGEVLGGGGGGGCFGVVRVGFGPVGRWSKVGTCVVSCCVVCMYAKAPLRMYLCTRYVAIVH